jgi:hypothetical protein
MTATFQGRRSGVAAPVEAVKCTAARLAFARPFGLHLTASPSSADEAARFRQSRAYDGTSAQIPTLRAFLLGRQARPGLREARLSRRHRGTRRH